MVKDIPGMRKVPLCNRTLCRVEFDDGTNSNESTPDHVLNDASTSAADWWHDNVGMVDSLSVMAGKRRAIKVLTMS